MKPKHGICKGQLLNPKLVICIQGPTASGKSLLAEELANKIGAEIVSADSMQIYRGMDIGTAKIVKSKYKIPYHCIDILDPGIPYSAALYQQDARYAIENIFKRGLTPIVCGGTGLYVRAALDEMDFASGEQQNNPTREKYTNIAKEHGASYLHALLMEKDPYSAKMIHPNNIRRVVRAFEMLEEGESYAKRKSKFKDIPSHYPTIRFALSVNVELLNEKINSRVDKMFDDGLYDEVKTLLDKGFRKGLTSQQAIGYKELVSHIEGNCSLEESLDAIKQATRRYAKRQRTWLRSDKRNIWINADDGITNKVIDECMQYIDGFIF